MQYSQYNNPGETEQPLNDKFRVAVAFLSHIGKQVIRKTDNRKNKQEDAGNQEKIFFL